MSPRSRRLLFAARHRALDLPMVVITGVLLLTRSLPAIALSAALSALECVEDGAKPAAPADRAAQAVSRSFGEFTAPPNRVPTNFNTDAPLLGNGDLGVIIGGPPERQRLWLSKCDFWRARPLYPWFTPALVGCLDVGIPALAGAKYHAEQRLDDAEVVHTFTTSATTVTMRSWTPATEHCLIVELSCTGRPVQVEIVPWTRQGEGATATAGAAEVAWFTRSFSGPEMDWPNDVAAALACAGGMPAGPDASPAPARPPAARSERRRLQIGREQHGGGRCGFSGSIADVRFYDRLLTDAELLALAAGTEPTAAPRLRWLLDQVPAVGAHGVSQAVGERGPALRFAGRPDSYLDLGDQDIPTAPATCSAWVFIDGYSPEANCVLSCGDWGDGLSIGFHEGHLAVAGAGHNARIAEPLPTRRWLHLALRSDGDEVEAFVDGHPVSSRPLRAPATSLTLAPDHPIRAVVAIATNHEGPAPLATAQGAAQQLAAAAVEPLRAAHRAWWRNFWSESEVELGDPLLERYYYGSFYIMACCSRNLAYPPALFGNDASGDLPAMGADYHMNYNHQAPWWGCYGANHIALTDAYDTPVLQFLEHGRMMAHDYLGKQGIYYCVGIGPGGSCSCWEKPHDKWRDDSEDKHFFAGQKANALWGGINLVMHWRATCDPAYGRKVYPYLRGLADFWEDWLVYEDGRYVDYHDNIHEGSPAPEGDMNNPMSLGLLRTELQATVELAVELGEDAGRRAKWQHILDHLSAFPVYERGGKRVFRYSERGQEWTEGSCAVGLQHIYPADTIGLDSPRDLLQVARNTVAAHYWAWTDENHTMTFYPCAARVGYDPEIILAHLRTVCHSDRALPNLVLDFHGGGIETCSTVTATLNEMLLQSHQGALRVFADWPRDRDAAFKRLRAQGAFLVSARLEGGVVRDLAVVSERGRPLVLVNPWPGRAVTLRRAAADPVALSGERFSIATSPGENLDFVPR